MPVEFDPPLDADQDKDGDLSADERFAASLEEIIGLFEQGQAPDQARFDELMSEIDSWRPQLAAVPEADPRAERARALLAAADALERRAAEGHGQMDEVNAFLAPIMGRKG